MFTFQFVDKLCYANKVGFGCDKQLATVLLKPFLHMGNVCWPLNESTPSFQLSFILCAKDGFSCASPRCVLQWPVEDLGSENLNKGNRQVLVATDISVITLVKSVSLPQPS